MGWIKIVGNGLVYTGKLAQAEGFEEWLSQQGKAIIENLAEKHAFTFFGKYRVGKILWNELSTAARSSTLSATLKREATTYQQVPGELAEIVEPNEFTAVCRPFVIPRFLVNKMALRGITERLSSSQELARLQGGEALQSYFFKQFVMQLDTAFTKMPFSIKKPVPTSENWVIIDYDDNYDWKDIEWKGHYYIVQTQGQEIGKPTATSLELLLADLKVKLGRLSPNEVQDISNKWHAWLEGNTQQLVEVSTKDS